MTKNELVSRLGAYLDLPAHLVRRMLDELINTAIKETKSKGQFVFPGIGRLVRANRKARMGRNPQTGETMKIPVKTVVKFRVDKVVRDLVLPQERRNKRTWQGVERASLKRGLGRKPKAKPGIPIQRSKKRDRAAVEKAVLLIKHTTEEVEELSTFLTDATPPRSEQPSEPLVYPLIDPKREHVVQTDVFLVNVSLRATPSPTTPGTVRLPPGERHTLEVHLLLGDYGAWDTLNWSRTRGTLKKAHFAVVAPRIEASASGSIPERLYVTLAANFYLKGRWCGEGLRNIEVLLHHKVEPSAHIPPPDAPMWAKFLNLEPGADPPDLLVRIQLVSDDIYQWTVLSPHMDFRPIQGRQIDRKQIPSGAHRFVRTNFDRVAGAALEDRTIPVIEQRCREIYESTTDSFKDAYWQLYRAHCGAAPDATQRVLGIKPKLESIQFISDEPYVPWELMLVREDDITRNPESVSEEILSIRHAVGRWIAKKSGQLMQKINVRKVAVFASDYAGVDDVEPKLPWAIEERELLTNQYGAEAGILKFEPVMHFLREGRAQAVHFSCHGEMNVEQPAESALRLEDFSKFVTAFVAKQEVREGQGSQHPVVFLNACQLASAGKQLSLVTGWPQAFVDAGASACVAPLWSVVDKNAKEVASIFYQLVFDQHKTLGEALRQIRSEWRTRHSLTFLSYVLYGDPMAQVVWKRSSDDNDAVI